jgi:hypothetical protein
MRPAGFSTIASVVVGHSDRADQGVRYPWASSTTGQTACDGFTLEPTMYLHIERWQDADLAVSALGAVLSERGLGETLLAIVEPESIECAL